MKCFVTLLREIEIETRQHEVTIRVLGWMPINLQEIKIETRQHEVTIRVLGWMAINSVDRLAINNNGMPFEITARNQNRDSPTQSHH